MKKTILFATIALAISSFVGCKKDETTTANTTTCNWDNTFLNGKTFNTTKIERGTGSSNDSIKAIATYSFTSDSLTRVYTQRVPQQTVTRAYKTLLINQKKYLQIGFDTLTVLNQDCNSFKFTTSDREPFDITLTKQ
jgi:hypothetical protein